MDGHTFSDGVYTVVLKYSVLRCSGTAQDAMEGVSKLSSSWSVSKSEPIKTDG